MTSHFALDEKLLRQNRSGLGFQILINIAHFCHPKQKNPGELDDGTGLIHFASPWVFKVKSL